jgi:phenylacetate-CoA ligase
MLPVIARRLICPAHEALLGRPTLRYLRELERSQWTSPDELRAVQGAKLRALLRHAHAHTPFYRRRFREAGIDRDPDDPLEALGRLPLLGKSEIRASIDDMLWHDAPGGLTEHNTGGSTGEPLIFYFDRRRQAYDQAARARSHRWFNVDVGDREVYLWGSPIELSRTDGIKGVRDRLFNHRLLSAFNMSPERMDAYLNVIERYRPACLFGYPSSISLLVEHAQERRYSLKTRSLRAVFVTGEVCYRHQRDAIAAYFGVPVADGYGTREAGFLAHECPMGEMHITAENVIIEIIKNGKPVPIGEAGEIVVTHLDAYGMPFIRYRSGDRGRLKPGRCPCGRGLPLMDVVDGRTTDFLYLPDGTVKHALSIIYPLRAMRGVRQFRVTQHEDYTVTVDVVADDCGGRITREAVARGIRPVLGEQVALQVKLVERIASMGSGKYRYVVSHAKVAARPVVTETAVGV